MATWLLLENTEALILVCSVKGPLEALPHKTDCEHYYGLEKDLTNKNKNE